MRHQHAKIVTVQIRYHAKPIASRVAMTLLARSGLKISMKIQGRKVAFDPISDASVGNAPLIDAD